VKDKAYDDDDNDENFDHSDDDDDNNDDHDNTDDPYALLNLESEYASVMLMVSPVKATVPAIP
jgi:ABC-type Zn2+ transport system substrate-binding protein/surface adhesin